MNILCNSNDVTVMTIYSYTLIIEVSLAGPEGQSDIYCWTKGQKEIKN